MTEYTNLSVKLNAETVEALRWMMQAEEETATNVVHEALSLLYFSKRKKLTGWQLAIVKRGKVRQIVMEEP